MNTHREVEAKYALPPDTELPDLSVLEDVAGVRSDGPVELAATYFDTPDLALARARVTLRRRTGGGDAGWHVKVPADDARLEIRRPLGRSAAPPKAVRDLVLGWTRDQDLVPVATITTRRTVTALLGEDDTVLAELADDRVTGSVPSGDEVRWREWEIELVDGDDALLDGADALLGDLGISRSATDSKLAHVLGDAVDLGTEPRRPKRGKPVSRLVQARLAALVEELARRDVEVRLGDDEGVHQLRVTCRRLRALLATSRSVVDREATDPVRDEVRWLARTLNDARDGAVVHERLRELVRGEPRTLVRGPVLGQLAAAYRGRGWAEVRAALSSPRYLALRERLDALVAEPPWTEDARRPAGTMVAKMLHKELRRVEERVAAADDDDPATLHDLRRSAKRLRYAAETAMPVGGKAAARLEDAAHAITSHLGDLQDTVVAREHLLALARDATTAGASAFTFGRLHRQQQTRAAELIAQFRSGPMLRHLEHRTKRAAKQLRAN